jgi:flagellar protein FlaG
MGIIVASVGGNRMGGVTVDRLPEPFRSRGAQAAEVTVASGKAAADQNRKFQDITRDLEQISLSFNKKLQFVVDHQSNEITVKVIDRATDKVVKVLPPEELQRLHSRIEETIGFLFDEKV